MVIGIVLEKGFSISTMLIIVSLALTLSLAVNASSNTLSCDSLAKALNDQDALQLSKTFFNSLQDKS